MQKDLVPRGWRRPGWFGRAGGTDAWRLGVCEADHLRALDPGACRHHPHPIVRIADTRSIPW